MTDQDNEFVFELKVRSFGHPERAVVAVSEIITRALELAIGADQFELKEFEKVSDLAVGGPPPWENLFDPNGIDLAGAPLNAVLIQVNAEAWDDGAWCVHFPNASGGLMVIPEGVAKFYGPPRGAFRGTITQLREYRELLLVAKDQAAQTAVGASGTPWTQSPDGHTIDLLTPAEHELMATLASVANQFRAIIGEGGQAEFDWGETAHEIHTLQQRVMSQAAGRAYPDKYRLMGGWPNDRQPGSWR